MSETLKGRYTIDMPERDPIKLPDGSVVVLSPVRVVDIPVRFYWLLVVGCGEDWGRVSE